MSWVVAAGPRAEVPHQAEISMASIQCQEGLVWHGTLAFNMLCKFFSFDFFHFSFFQIKKNISNERHVEPGGEAVPISKERSHHLWEASACLPCIRATSTSCPLVNESCQNLRLYVVVRIMEMINYDDTVR